MNITSVYCLTNFSRISRDLGNYQDSGNIQTKKFWISTEFLNNIIRAKMIKGISHTIHPGFRIFS